MLKIFVLLLLFGACGKKDLTEVNLSYVKTPLNVPAIINVKSDILVDQLAEQNIKVHYHTLFNGAQQVSALASGDLDIVPTMGSTSALIGLANNAPIKIVGMFGRSPKAFVLAVKDPSINSITDLKGKTIAGPKGSVLHQLLLRLLETHNMTTSDIEFISLDVSEALPTMLKGDIDGALLVGAASMVSQQRGAKIIHTGEGLVDGATLIVVREDFVKNHSNIVKQYLQAHQQNIDFMHSHPEETLTLLTEEVELPRPMIQRMLPDYDFSIEITDIDFKNLQDTHDFLHKEGLIPNKVDIKSKIVTNL